MKKTIEITFFKTVIHNLLNNITIIIRKGEKKCFFLNTSFNTIQYKMYTSTTM